MNTRALARRWIPYTAACVIIVAGIASTLRILKHRSSSRLATQLLLGDEHSRMRAIDTMIRIGRPPDHRPLIREACYDETENVGYAAIRCLLGYHHTDDLLVASRFVTHADGDFSWQLFGSILDTLRYGDVAYASDPRAWFNRCRAESDASSVEADRVIPVHAGGVRDIIVCAENVVVSLGCDNTIVRVSGEGMPQTLWRVASGPARAIARLEDDTIIAITSNGIEQAPGRIVPMHAMVGPVVSAAAGAKIIAIGDRDGFISIVDIRNLGLVSRWRAHSGAVTDIVMLPGDSTLVSSGDDQYVRVWNRILDMPSSTNEVVASTGLLCIAANADGSMVVGAGRSGVIWLWDMKSQGIYREWTGGHAWIVDIAVDWERRVVVSGGADGIVTEWLFDEQSPRASFRAASHWISRVAFRDNTIVVGSLDGAIYMWSSKW